jgi:NAD(P)-dependent dehydrogenase (short-subunit alcohol dehydrogenase family)
MRQDSVLITGASSGIGEALALALARPGATLHLGGRDTARLEQVATACRARGAAVQAQPLDVTNENGVADWIDNSGRLDLVLACAGISGGTDGGGNGTAGTEPASQARRIMAVNLDGVLNTVLPAVARMRAQPPGPDGVRGRIAAISSIAAFVSSPTAPSYCASKAAVDRWMLATGAGLRPLGVRLSSVCCGFVRTRMTADNAFPMPGLMDADRAAHLILRGIARGQRRVVFPRWMAAASRGLDLLPPAWSEALLMRQEGKPSLAASAATG